MISEKSAIARLLEVPLAASGNATLGFNSTQKMAWRVPVGTLERGLERDLFSVEHHRLLPLLDLTLGEVLG